MEGLRLTIRTEGTKVFVYHDQGRGRGDTITRGEEKEPRSRRKKR